MSDDQEQTGAPASKIIVGEDGLGTITPEMVEERALELARMDGRTEPHNGDRDRAQKELQGVVDDGTPPEAVEKEIENVVAWDEAPEDAGARVPKILPEDEANIAVSLVEEGLEEAEHDRRRSAVEGNPPEEEEG